MPPNYLNLIDFGAVFSNIYNFFHAAPSADSAYTWLVSLASIVTVVGLGLAFIMLVLLVYVSIRLEQIEHAGFHHREMAEHIVHETHAAHEAKNPRWEGVSMLAASPDESDWRRAIMEADIMLSDMMREHGYTGRDIGEQFANANPLQFTTLDIAREAHRMRNALAHLGEAFPLSERDARATIDQYRRVFEEFDYI